MNYKQILSKAQSECGYLRDADCIGIYIASSRNDSIKNDIFNSAQREIEKNHIHAKVFRSGSFGYYDLEPILVIEKSGEPPILYGNLSTDSIPDFIREVLIECKQGSGGVFSPLSGVQLFQLESRIALRNCGMLDPGNINHYLLKGNGYSGLAKAMEMGQEATIEELKGSGLRGRGGSGYVTADKWQICHEAEGKEKVMICNAIDADPDSVTSRLLLDGDPHSVLEGMLIGAYAVGADCCMVCINKRYEQAFKSVRSAINQMRLCSLEGEKIMGSPFCCRIEVIEIPDYLVSGEETAILRLIEGRQPMPYIRPPYPAEKGLGEKPVLVNNSETCANISAIFQNGAEWFSGFGLAHSRGTKVVNLTGDIVHKYTVEVDFGTRLIEIIEEIGGGTPDGKEIKAVQFGGPTGEYFSPNSLDTPLDYRVMKEKGSIIGSGTLQVIDNDTCMVERSRDVISYLQSQSCGKCVFCREGTHQMYDILTDISGKEGKPEDLNLLLEIGDAMKTGCICALGRTAPNPVLSSITLFRDEYDFHIKEKKCPLGKND
ncbi:MAG: NADH-quinone oxidoreductase subunit F [Deltaproteobacteria bacterium]|nr:NADH-quinone oxidoreductase subunit F [Deltaproteobacteria bacterium]